MELSELKNKFCNSFKGTQEELELLLELFDRDVASYPFNEYELLISSMIAKGGISYDEYLDIRSEYIASNPNLWVFEISAPRAFGERYAQTMLQAISNKLLKPRKKLDPAYKGQYDLWCDGVRIEVKASRVTDSDMDSNLPLYKKALSIGTKRNFLMNFQQLKPQCCDVFVFVAVYTDNTTIWVMSSKEVKNHPDYSKGQHRGNNGNEGQLHITQENIRTLDPYETEGTNLIQAIKMAATR